MSGLWRKLLEYTVNKPLAEGTEFLRKSIKEVISDGISQTQNAINIVKNAG